MSGLGKNFALSFVFIFLVALVTLTSGTVKAADIAVGKNYFPLLDQNATIILSNGASYAESNFCAAHNTSEGFVPSSWLFSMFSIGNGTTGLTISAHNCNVTVTSYSYFLKDMGGYNFKADTWLNYTVTGTGNQTLDYSALYNLNKSNPAVYIDGVAKQQSDCWNWANFGITVSGASSNVSIHQQDMLYQPPRNPPHLPIEQYYIFIIAVAIVIAALAVFLLILNRHMH